MKPSIDLTTCDKEKIHQISYVQGHGAFVAVSPLDLKIHNASENLPKFFNQDENIQVFLGRKLNEILSLDLCNKVQEKLRSGTIREGQHRRFVYHPDLEVFMYKISDKLYGVEFERFEPVQNDVIPPEDALNQFVSKMHMSKNLEGLAQEACRALRYLTGMDRVMVYKFFPPSMYGEVIGEDKTAEAQTFLRHRFPATDIPKPARDLYLRNQVRFIYDSHAATSEIYPKALNDKFEPLNMSDSRIRGVSLVHIEYLKNMGVRGSLSIAIIVEGKLWGLISCHGNNPIYVSQATRTMCETIAHTLAIGASMFEQMKTVKEELSFFNNLHDLFSKLKKVHNPLDQLFREGTSVLRLFQCHGMVLASPTKIDFFGITPLPDDIKKIWGWILSRMDDEGRSILISESIAEMRPEFADMKDQVSGLMAVRLSEVSDRVLILMRSEFVETIKWGGDPRKNIDARSYGGIINPRASFETWTEVVKNSSTPWTKYEVAGLQHFKEMIFDTIVSKEEIMVELHEKIRTLKN